MRRTAPTLIAPRHSSLASWNPLSATLLSLIILPLAAAVQDQAIYGMLVDSQFVYDSKGHARDTVMQNGCFKGYGYQHCSSLDGGPGLSNDGFHWRSAGVGVGKDFCLECCNYNRQLRMFTETWNLKCPIAKNPEVDPQAFEMEFHFVQRKTPNAEDVVGCRIPRRPDRQRVTITRRDKSKKISGHFKLGIPACMRIRNRKYEIYRPKTNAPTPYPTPFTPLPPTPLDALSMPTPKPTPPTPIPLPPLPKPVCRDASGLCVDGNLCENDKFPPYECMKCPPGEYADLYPPYGCLQCNVCDAGKERVNCRGNDEGQCRLCPQGRYKLGKETWDSRCATCQACPLGERLEGCSLSNNGTCVRCARGRYSDVTTSENFLAVASCSQCALCPTGWWRRKCGGGEGEYGSAGWCAPCETCPNGKYRFNCGSCLTPPSASLDLSVRIHGNPIFQEYDGVSCGTQDPIDRLYPGECRHCPTGKWRKLGVGQTERWNDQCYHCLPCPPGQERKDCSGPNEGYCHDCPAGQYKPPCPREPCWSQRCEPCKDGYQQPFTGQDRCILPHCNKWLTGDRVVYSTEAIQFNAFGDKWEELRMFNGTQRPGEGNGESVASKLMQPVIEIRNHTLDNVPLYGPFTVMRTPPQVPGTKNFGEQSANGEFMEADIDEISYEIVFNGLGFNAPKLQPENYLTNADIKVEIVDGYDYERGVHIGMQLHGYVLSMEVREKSGPDGFSFWREVIQCHVNTTERDYGSRQPDFLYESYRLKMSPAAPRIAFRSLLTCALVTLAASIISLMQ